MNDMLNEIDQLDMVKAIITKRLGTECLDMAVVKQDGLEVEIGMDDFITLAKFIHDHSDCDFAQLSDITAVDFPDHEKRFCLVYHFLSLKVQCRLRVKLWVKEGEDAPSLCHLWPAANWYEREVWDMYGIGFTNHPDLRRILTDYGFDGHPQRKDFPLTGRVELRYDEKLGRIVYEPVKLAQDFRNFDFLSPWEGQNGVASSSAKKVKEDK